MYMLRRGFLYKDVLLRASGLGLDILTDLLFYLKNRGPQTSFS